MKRSTTFGIFVTVAILAFFLIQIVDMSSDKPPKNQETQDFDITLISERSGENAISDVKVMHGGSEKLKLVDVRIMDYLTNDGRAIKVWIGVAENETSARNMLIKMDSKLRYSNSFIPAGKITFDDIEVYKADGMGVKNFYYAKGNSVIWVAGNLSDTEFLKVVYLLSGLSVSY